MLRRLLPLLPLAALLFCPLPTVEPEADVVVGSKAFPESVILGEVLRCSANAAGVRAAHRRSIGGTAPVFSALQGGEIDAYPDYTGTLRRELFSGEDLPTDAALRAHLESLGLGMTDPLGFNNSYELAVTRDTAERLELRTISDLRDHPDLRVGLSAEFLNREDGWKGLRLRYGLPQVSVSGMVHELAYRQLETGEIDVTDTYTTDAQVGRLDLVVLEDDRDFFPEYAAVIVYRSDLPERFPEVHRTWSELAGKITASKMVRMNVRAVDEQVPEDRVAAEFVGKLTGADINAESISRVERVWQRTVEHLGLVRWSLLPAVLIAVPLGVVSAKRKWLGAAVLGITGVVQTIPALALLVLLIAPVQAVGGSVVGAGSLVALSALFLYSLLPIVRNTTAGVMSISPALTESATVLGLSRVRRLVLIELPLASPMILAGVKTAAVMNIGFATLGALIGAGGYGQPILAGVQLNDYGRILEGAIPAALLAIVAQLAFALAERSIVPEPLRRG